MNWTSDPAQRRREGSLCTCYSPSHNAPPPLTAPEYSSGVPPVCDRLPAIGSRRAQEGEACRGHDLEIKSSEALAQGVPKTHRRPARSIQDRLGRWSGARARLRPRVGRGGVRRSAGRAAEKLSHSCPSKARAGRGATLTSSRSLDRHVQLLKLRSVFAPRFAHAYRSLWRFPQRSGLGASVTVPVAYCAAAMTYSSTPRGGRIEPTSSPGRASRPDLSSVRTRTALRPTARLPRRRLSSALTLRRREFPRDSGGWAAISSSLAKSFGKRRE